MVNIVRKKKQKKKKKKLKKFKPKTRIKYEKMQCKFIKKNKKRCKSFACGKSTLCKKHGGKSVIQDNLVPAGEILPIHLKLTKFDPAVHPLSYISMAGQGLTPIEIAANFEISMGTLTKWEQSYQEMATACEIGKALQISWWLKQGKDALKDSRYNNTMFKFLTGNTIGWSDKIEQKNTNMNVHGVLVVPDKMTVTEWEQKAAEANKKQDVIDAEFFEVD